VIRKVLIGVLVFLVLALTFQIRQWARPRVHERFQPAVVKVVAYLHLASSEGKSVGISSLVGTGLVIAGRYVLTAGHLVPRVLEVDMFGRTVKLNVAMMEVGITLPEPNKWGYYDMVSAKVLVRGKDLINEDWALLELEKPWPYSIYVEPASAQIGDEVYLSFSTKTALMVLLRARVVSSTLQLQKAFIEYGIITFTKDPPRELLVLDRIVIPGMSGSPVFDEEGRLIGIATFAAGPICGVVPAAKFKNWINKLYYTEELVKVVDEAVFW